MMKTSPFRVLSSETPREAATRFASWLRQKARECGYDPKDVVLWSPQRTAELGWGSGWAVCWEGGPYDWAVNLSLGAGLFAGESESYSKPGPFAPWGLSVTGKWFVEPYNGFILNFYEG
jgi:hypothetical protein